MSDHPAVVADLRLGGRERLGGGGLEPERREADRAGRGGAHRGTFYQTKWIPGSTATDDEKALLRHDVVLDIVERSHPIVANVYPTGTDVDRYAHSYSA